MINNDAMIQEFTSMVTQFYASLKKINKLNMLNASVASEKWVAEVCSILWNEKLKRSSTFTANADSYDLEGGPIAVQVTSNMSAEKIIKTVKEFDNRKHADQHPVLYIFLLGDRPDYTSEALNAAIVNVGFVFDRKQHIVGADQLIALVSNLDIGPLKRVLEVSRAYFEQESAALSARRSHLEKNLAEYKDRLRPLLNRLFEAKTLAKKYSDKPISSSSCERIVEAMARTKDLCLRVLKLYTAIAKAIPLTSSWELNNYDQLAIETAQHMHDFDLRIEDLMRHMEREWELGSLIERLESDDQKIAALTKELAKLSQEKDAVEKEMQSLEFAMKILAP